MAKMSKLIPLLEDSLDELKALGWVKDLKLSRKASEDDLEFFFFKNKRGMHAKLYLYKSVFSCGYDIAFYEGEKQVAKWKKDIEAENAIRSDMALAECISGIGQLLENYFDGVRDNYKLDKKGNIINANP